MIRPWINGLDSNRFIVNKVYELDVNCDTSEETGDQFELIIIVWGTCKDDIYWSSGPDLFTVE